MQRKIHTFDNGVKVYDDQLSSAQRKRYKKRNVHEAEEEGIFIEIVKSIPIDGCFVNIGCAIGYYPILARKLSPGLTIHAVEPLDLHRRYFVENIGLNGFHSDDFFLHREGISSKEGFELFIEAGYGSRMAHGQQKGQSLKFRTKANIKALLAQLGVYDSKPQKMKMIETMTLDRLINIVGRPIDLLQMDVQGLELDVLKGGMHSLQVGCVKSFLIGTYSPKLHQECIDILRKYGYVHCCPINS